MKHTSVTRWTNETINLRDGLPGGPLVIFDKEGHVVIISTFSEFMSTSSQHEGFSGGNMTWGVLGSVTEIPAGHVCKVIVYYSNGGINQVRMGLVLPF